jgi:transposase
MMVALLLYGYCQGERSSRVIECRCVRDAGYRVIAGGLHPGSRHDRPVPGAA